MRQNFYTSDQEAIKSAYYGALRAASKEQPWLVGIFVFLLSFLVGVLAFTVKPFIRKNMGERSFGVITIVAAFFVYQIYEAATYKAIERTYSEKIQGLKPYSDSLKEISTELSVLRGKCSRLDSVSYQIQKKAIYGEYSDVYSVRYYRFKNKHLENKKVIINFSDLMDGVSDWSTLLNPFPSGNKIGAVLKYPPPGNSPILLSYVALTHEPPDNPEEMVKMIDNAQNNVKSLRDDIGGNVPKSSIVQKQETTAGFFYIMIKIAYLFSAFSILFFTWLRKLKNIRMHSYHRGQSLVFGWLEGRKFGKRRIQDYHINMLLDPLFLLLIASFLAFWMDTPTYSYLSIIPLGGAFGIFIEEVFYYTRRRNVLLDMVDAEIESEYLLNKKASLVTDDEAKIFPRSGAYGEEVGQATMP